MHYDWLKMKKMELEGNRRYVKSLVKIFVFFIFVMVIFCTLEKLKIIA